MSATWIGGGYINGTAEVTYSSGLVWAQAPWGYALSLFVGGLFFAKKMRNLQFKTMLDPIQQRFGHNATTLFFFPALLGEIFWTAAILSALGATFGILLGLDFEWSIILSAFIAVAYTSIGGLWAVALTDVVQLILLFLGLFIALWGVRRILEMIVSHRAPSSFNMSSYRAIWTHFTPNSMIFKNLILQTLQMAGIWDGFMIIDS